MEELLDIEFDDISLDGYVNEVEGTPPENNNSTEEVDGNKPETKVETDPNLESVGTGDKEIKDTQVKETGSPKDFTSIATFFKNLGIFKTLNQEEIDSYIENHKEDDLDDAIHGLLDLEVYNRTDSTNKMAAKAKRYNVPDSAIAQYENNINILESITDENIETEGTQSEQNRKILIINNYVSKGISQEEAIELAERSIKNGSDIEDAKKARLELLKAYKTAYNNEINLAAKAEEDNKKKLRKDLDDLQKSIIEDDKLFKALEISSEDRNKIYDAITKPVETRNNRKLTAIQKFAQDNPIEYQKLIGLMWVMTEGGTKIDKLVKAPATKKANKVAKEFANLINTTIKDDDMSYSSGVSEDKQNLLDLAGIDIDFD